MKQDVRDIQEYLDGSMAAFHRIYTRYERQLFFYINSMVRHKETTEDIFQDVWMQVVAKLPKFSFKGAFRNWLYTIAHHKVIDHMRASGRHKTLNLSDEIDRETGLTLEDVLADPAPDVIRRLSARELHEKVMDIVATLPEPQREVFLLRCDAGLKFREIAEMAGTSVNTILGRMHYAITRIRRELHNELDS